MVSDVVGAELTVVDVIEVAASATPDWIWFSSKTLVVRPPAQVVQVI